MTDTVFFCHMQKTGGISLSRQLREALGDRAIYPADDDGPAPQRTISVSHLLQRLEQRTTPPAVICGHFPFCVAELLGEPPAFTVLRDPVDRVVSALRHQKRAVPEQADKSLEEIYDDPMRAALLWTNHMTRMLALSTDEIQDDAMFTPIGDSHDVRARAAEALDHFEFIGFQENYGALAPAIETHFGWRLGPELRLNAATDRVPASAALLAQIAADNEADLELLERARAHPSALV